MEKKRLGLIGLYAVCLVPALFFASLPISARTVGLTGVFAFILINFVLFVPLLIGAILWFHNHPIFPLHYLVAPGLIVGGFFLGISLDGSGRGAIFNLNYGSYHRFVQETLRHPPESKPGERASLPVVDGLGTLGCDYFIEKGQPVIEIRTDAGGLSYDATFFSKTPLRGLPPYPRLSLVKKDDIGFWYFSERE